MQNVIHNTGGNSISNYKKILRLHSLGINNARIAESCGCGRSTVIAALQRAAEQELFWHKIKNCSTEEVARKLYPSTVLSQQYKMPDYEWVHREMQKSGVTRILTPDNLKTGIVKNSRTETVLNKSYQEMAEHYGTAILPARPRSPKDKAFVEGSVGVVSTWILAALRNRQFLSLMELNEAIYEKLKPLTTSPSRNGRAAGQLVLRRRNYSCCLFRLRRLSWRSGRSPPSSITTTSAWSA